MNRSFNSCFLTFVFLLLLSISCSTKEETGTISVYVTDNDPDETPVPDAMITLFPDSIMETTNENGFCSFDVDPGDYFIDADLCCIGPGFIHYHEPVTVQKGKNVDVKLLACLNCD
jgi:hypothetical protein